MKHWPSEFRRGARIVEAELPDGYTPPSVSMNPDATVTPWPSAEKIAAQIKRVGRWRYEIRVLNGDGWIATEYGRWYRWGRKRAEVKARRELARYRAEEERETWTIT